MKFFLRLFFFGSLFFHTSFVRAEAILDLIRRAYFSEINTESGRAAFLSHSHKVLSGLAHENFLLEAANPDGGSELMIVKLEANMTIEGDRYTIRDVYLLNHFFRVNQQSVESHQGVLSIMAAFVEGDVNRSSEEKVRLRFDGFRVLK